MKSTYKIIKTRFDPEISQRIADNSKIEFEKLIPEIPYTGGRKNIFSGMQNNAAVILSLYRTLKMEGISLEEFGDILESITKEYMNKYPALVRKLAGKIWMSKYLRKMFSKKAQISKKRIYEDDFVYEIVEGNEKYRWGINYLECGIVKFLNKQGEKDLAQYACLLDFLMFPSIGVTLERTGTIAKGCDMCDFRFI